MSVAVLLTPLGQELSDIKGLGLNVINKLVDAGVTSTLDLRIPKYYDMLPVMTQIHVTHNIMSCIPRSFIDDLLTQLPENIIGVGSYRRGKAFANDVDLLTTTDLSDMIRQIEASPVVEVISIYSDGDTKKAFIARFRNKYVRVDLNHTEPDLLAFALLHHTGSKQHNIQLRSYVKSKGWMLNRRGLTRKKDDMSIKCSTEQSIYKAIGRPYTPPYMR